jgi:hypothetical protein
MRARENPFRTERLERLDFRHPSLSAKEIHARWVTCGRRAAIVGPHGSGKTTLLREIAARAEREGFRVVRWFRNADSPPAHARAIASEARELGPADVLVFDGAGHLSRWAWRRVARACRGAAGVLVTAHAPGLLPTLIETRTDAHLLTVLFDELDATGRSPLRRHLGPLCERHDGNLRDVFLALYDLAARDGR